MIICNEKELYYKPVMWVFELIKKAYHVDLFNDAKINIKIGTSREDHIQLSRDFYIDIINNQKYRYQNYFDKAPLVTLEDGAPDYISSIFYLVNGFQEYDNQPEELDKYGRLKYSDSLQCAYDILQKDLVKDYVQKLLYQIDTSLKIPVAKSRIFISHDIDSVYGSLKYDGLWALKSGNVIQMMKVILQIVMMNPPWFNIDKVAKLESEYDIKACYYWIVENGRDKNGIRNGDYDFQSSKIQRQVDIVKSLKNEMGLHKSTMETSFEQEIGSIPGTENNRFHFLKINNPESFREMERSGIRSDSSIGFPYKMGFTNSFGMPYYPYDIEHQQRFNVLEIPLQIMDGMFDIKDEASSQNAYTSITEFIEANNTNAIISILWHNSEMTNFAYKWSFDCYKKLLQYFVDMKFETVLPSQLIKEYESD